MKKIKEKLAQKLEAGFVKEIVIIVVALVALKYFWNIDVVGYLANGPLTKVFDWIKSKV